MPALRSGPEVLLEVAPVVFDGDQAVATMPVGPWCSGPDGRVAAGALGPLVDDVLGIAILDHRPPGRWSVSSDISLDVFPGLSHADGRLRAEARLVHVDTVSGFATATVTDRRGTIVATATQRGRFVSADEPPFDTGYALEPARRSGGLVDLLGLRPDGDGRTFTLSAALQNPMGNLHGGAALAVVDTAARCALVRPDAGAPLTTFGMRVQYLRPVPGGAKVSVRTDIDHLGRSSALVRVVCSVDGTACVSGVVTAGPSSP